MSVQALLSKVRQLAAKEADDAAGRYAAAVKAVGSGKPIDPEKLLKVIADAGKTADDFEREAGAVAQRLADKAKAAEKPRYERDRADALARLTKAKAVLEAAERAYEETAWPIDAEIRAADARIAECQQAAQRVQAGGNADPAIQARRVELNRTKDRLAKAREKAVGERDYCGNIENYTRGEPWEHPRTPAEVAAGHAKARQLAGYIEEIDAQAAEIDATLAKLEQEAVDL